MKLHLPIAMLAAFVSAAAYGEDSSKVISATYNGITYELDNSVIAPHATAGSTTVTITGDYDKSKPVYVNDKAGVGGAAHIADGSNPNTLNGNPSIRYSSTNVIVGDSDANTEDPTLKYVFGSGPRSNTVVGDKNITVYSGDINYVIGGTHYGSMKSANLEGVYNYRFGNQHYYAYKDSSAPADVNITVNGGKIGQIRGGNDQSHQEYIANWCYKAQTDGSVTLYQRADDGTITSTKVTYSELMANKPWSISGDVNIDIAGGTVGNGKDSEAILGAGGSGHSVDGKVTINVSGGTVDGSIYAGSRNIYSEVRGGTEVNISGGEVTGNVYGGGNIDDGATKPADWGMTFDKNNPLPSPKVVGDTKVTISGGIIDGNVYGAGIGDIVTGNTNVTVSGGTIKGTVYGGGTDGSSVVEGTKSLTVTTGYEGALSIADFDAVTIENGTQIKLESVGSQLALSDVAFTAYSDSEDTQGASMTLGNGITIDSLEFVVVITNEDLVYGNTFTLNLLELIDGANSTELMSIQDLGVATADESGLDYTLTFVDENGRELGLKDSDYNMTVNTTGNTTSYQVSVTIPEPTTATLSLLALAGLAARRRRK